MARPQKHTIDYFSHDCDHGKTLFVLESQFGNDGYAFWFKLLECLGKSENQSYNFNNASSRVFLLAKTRVNEETARNILSMLSDMEAIDRELWAQGIIWSQNFVDRLSDVYTRRKVEKPLKPTLTPMDDSLCKHKPGQSEQLDNINPQIKVNEIKVNEIKDSCPELSADAEPQRPPVTPFITIPLNDKSEYPVDITLIEEWKNLFPKIDVEQCLRNIRAWNLSHVKERKTKAGILKHINTWLAKEQDKGGGNGNGTSYTGKTFTKTGGAQSDGEAWPEPRTY